MDFTTRQKQLIDEAIELHLRSVESLEERDALNEEFENIQNKIWCKEQERFEASCVWLCETCKGIFGSPEEAEEMGCNTNELIPCAQYEESHGDIKWFLMRDIKVEKREIKEIKEA